ncbi:MAG: flagellar basal body P-ring formation protein FlgA [Fidelibacterota bacterium]|nr:MAG: flagellar basal body P-ring formation protein FlgA [Candidatus Neomarinimicrobiota bacterium]
MNFYRRHPALIRYTFVMVALVCAPGASLWSGDDSPGAVFLRDRVEQVVYDHVREGFERGGLRGEVVAIQMPSIVAEMHPSAAIRPLRTFTPQKAAGRYVIPVEVAPESSAPTKVSVTVECVALINAWEACFPIKRGSPLKPRDFQRKLIRVTKRERDYIVADSLPEGYQLNASLTQGQLLQFHHLEEIPIVQRGEQVMIHVHRQNLTLVSPGKARREGGIGDLIPVVASATGKRLYGRLVSPGIVVVE